MVAATKTGQGSITDQSQSVTCCERNLNSSRGARFLNFFTKTRQATAMETHTKALSLPTWAEMLTACQRPERGCVLSLVFTPKTEKESDSATETQIYIYIKKTGHVQMFSMTVDLQTDQMWSLNAKTFVCFLLKGAYSQRTMLQP